MGPTSAGIDPPRQADGDVGSRAVGRGAAPAGRTGVRFRADLDLAELDDRRRPGAAWSGRGIELSRSHLTVLSKRMCYTGRLLLVAVHMLDDRPVPLFGQVKHCDYDGEGLYRTEIALMVLPAEEPIRQWIQAQGAQGSM
jgi:hypothetical protein